MKHVSEFASIDDAVVWQQQGSSRSLVVDGGNYVLSSDVVLTRALCLRGDGTYPTIDFGGHTVHGCYSLYLSGLRLCNSSIAFHPRRFVDAPLDYEVIASDLVCEKFDRVFNLNEGRVTRFSLTNSRCISSIQDETYVTKLTPTGGLQNVAISGNVVEGFSRGFQVGNNDIGCQHAIITNNSIRDCVRLSNGEAHGVQAYGSYVVISHNIIRDVASGDGNDAEGIYTKISEGVISNNILVNGGQDEAAIAMKGSYETDGQILCHGNLIYWEDEAWHNSTHGILAKGQNTFISGNHIVNANSVPVIWRGPD